MGMKSYAGQFGMVRRLLVCRQRSTVQSADVMKETTEVRPFSEVPEPKGLPVFGTMFHTLRYVSRLHEKIHQRHKTFGPIYKEKLGKLDIVFLRDVGAVEQLLRQEGKYPSRLPMDLWKETAQSSGVTYGLFLSEGEEWHALRRVMDKYMMKVKTVATYSPKVNQIIEEFLDRMESIRTPNLEIPHLDQELFNWSLESICYILFERRLGCLSDNRGKDTQNFINSVREYFTTSAKIIHLPPSVAKIISPGIFKRFNKASDGIIEFVHKTIDEGISRVEKYGGEHEGFLPYLLKEDSLTIKDVYANYRELMTAAVDTTSNTMLMALYELSRNPYVQDAIYREITRVVPRGRQPEAEHLRDMPYIKSVVKETLRMHPVGAILARKLPQDAILNGYRIPKGVLVWTDLYSYGRLETQFADPNTFRPERWMRDTRVTKPNPFAWLPFGFGPRMCVGRRIAELELHLILSQLIRQFRIEPVSMEPVQMKSGFLLIPKDPIRIRLHRRQNQN